ncbi:MAG: hypothetical protein A2Y77_16305 [Planctomycetes bacterium RBG_13_62_9]|nr:MAG: hypothetical protein A2Y77_16305 [Planctomycetes bacterium RBG_13_62_9]
MAQRRRTARNHPREMESKLDKMSQELRRDVEKIDDPRGQALFEAAAEVLTGLQTAFRHYDSESGEVWK